MVQLQRVVVMSEQLDGQQIHLTVDQQHYLSHVLRLGVGDRMIAMTGQGQSWLVCLEPGQSSSQWQAKILEPIQAQTELPIAVSLIVALPKGNAFDEVVRQTTELGVTTLHPVISDRTLLQPSAQKLTRWRRIAQEAAEQSERQIVPILLDPVPVAFVLTAAACSTPDTRYPTPTLRYICVARSPAPHLLDCLLREQSQQTEEMNGVAIAIGPEGGWTEAELEQAICAGYQPVSLGRRILRTVTAPITALSLVAAVYEHINCEV